MKVVELKLEDEDGNIEYLNQVMVNNELNSSEEVLQKKKFRKISLLSERIRKLIDEEELEGLCLFRFYENITIRNLDSKKVSSGQRFQIGETVLEVVSIGERCFKECKLIQSGEECDLFTHVIFTKIIKSGFVKVDDVVSDLGKE